MRVVQVFNWFCKEQKIVPLVREFFYSISPTRMEYKDGGIESIPLSFSEYIENKIYNNSFYDLFFSILADYRLNMCRRMSYDVYARKYVDLEKKIDRINRKWNYFVKRNLSLSDDTFLKVGETVDVKSWGVDKRMTIERVDLPFSYIRGKYVGENQNTYTSHTAFGTLKDKDKLNYYIKRNRRVYNGADSK